MIYKYFTDDIPNDKSKIFGMDNGDIEKWD
jgi:hypothetical protein